MSTLFDDLCEGLLEAMRFMSGYYIKNPTIHLYEKYGLRMKCGAAREENKERQMRQIYSSLTCPNKDI